MRISDWSSDVCSSDLRNPLVRVRADLYAPHRQCVGGGRRDRRLWLQPRDSGARGAGGNPEREGAELFPLLRLSEAAIDRISDEPEDGGDRRRSEEHTSELQSLMRISYAVFCLKKKHTIQIHHN